jgi:hypothetical protein
MKTIKFKQYILLILIVLFSQLLILSTSSAQNKSCLRLVDENHEQIFEFNKETMSNGFGVEICFKGLNPEAITQLHVMMGDGTALSPLNLKQMKNMQKKLGSDYMSIWFSNDWTENMPKGFIPSSVKSQLISGSNLELIAVLVDVTKQKLNIEGITNSRDYYNSLKSSNAKILGFDTAKRKMEM